MRPVSCVSSGWPGVLACLAAAAFSIQAAYPVNGGQAVQSFLLPGDAGWLDTGLDVEEGQVLIIQAEGQIILQKGNPIPPCGPEGYDLRSVQQPLPEHNMGAAVGKVVQLLSVTKDEKTGEETRNELVKFFYVGRESVVAMPLTGRLFLGLNENVVMDNGGQFSFRVSRRED